MVPGGMHAGIVLQACELGQRNRIQKRGLSSREIISSGEPGGQAILRNRTLKEEVVAKEKKGCKRTKRGVSQRSGE